MAALAWEAAARTASEDKRRLLAKVVAAALRGGDGAEIDDLQFLLRTVMDLDPPHVMLLCMIAEPLRPEQLPPAVGEQSNRWGVGRGSLRGSWPGSRAAPDAALATLE